MAGIRRSYSTSSIVRYTELESRPTNYIIRTNSFQNVNDFTRAVDRFVPRASDYNTPNSQSVWPHRYYRPSYQMDSYWWDKYYYFSPKYKATQPYKRHDSSYRITYPCSWNYPHVYWARHRNYSYEDDSHLTSTKFRNNYEPYYGEQQYRSWDRYQTHQKDDVHLQNKVYPIGYHFPKDFYHYPVYIRHPTMNQWP